jgi:hypothetical protein
MIRYFVFFLLLLSSKLIFGSEGSIKIGDQYYSIELRSKGSILISKGCKKCQAELALTKSMDLEPTGYLELGRNPGVQACEELGGKVRLTLDGKRNQTSYCLFGDNSIINAGALAKSLINKR